MQSKSNAQCAVGGILRVNINGTKLNMKPETFIEALKILDIEKYSERIFNSNSHGELFHLQQYFTLAETLGKTDWFKDGFEEIVKQAEEKWERPESVFQHISKILNENVSNDA